MEGVAIFYKKTQFKLVDCKKVEYFVSTTEVLDRDNVGEVLVVGYLPSFRLLCDIM